jgi:tight adherence protein B
MIRTLVIVLLLTGALLTSTVAAFGQDDVDRHLVIEGLQAGDDGLLQVTVRPPAVTALDPLRDLRVQEDGARRAVEVTRLTADQQWLVVLLDTTGSMDDLAMASVRAATTTLVASLPSEMNVAVAAFSDRMRVVSPFGDDAESRLVAIADLRAGGRTALYDSLIAATDLFPEVAAGSRTILLVTDGDDNASERSADEATARLLEAQAVVHVVEYRTDPGPARAFADATGGSIRSAEDEATLTEVNAVLSRQLEDRLVATFRAQVSGRTEVTVSFDGLADRQWVDLPDDREAGTAPPPLDQTADPAGNTPALDATTANRGGPGLLGDAGALGPLAATWFVALFLLFGTLLRPRRPSALPLVARSTSTPDTARVGRRARLVALVERSNWYRRTATRLQRTGIDRDPGSMLLLFLGAEALALVAGSVLVGPLGGVGFLLVTATIPPLVLRSRESRRQARFLEQFPEAVLLLAGELRVGHSLLQAVDGVAREAPSPTAEEFGRVIVETRFGRDLGAALREMNERVGGEDLRTVVQAIDINREVGGDLAEVLDTVAGTIRERDELRRTVRTLSAEGRASATILSLMPIALALFLTVSNPEYFRPLLSGGALGYGMIIGAVILLATGLLWMRKLIAVRI